MDSHQEQQTPIPQPAAKPDITFFAQTNFRNEQRRFGIRRDDRRRHMYVVGKTGMGKSTMLENMIIQDIQNGEGLAVVDPHGDLVEKVVKYIPSNRINDVVYFNPSDTDFPIAFNILENVSPEYKHLVSNGLVGVFKKIWADSWGPRLEYILINTILALLEYPGSTLLGVTRMLVDAKYRKKIIRNISDPVVKAFWVSEYNNYTEKFRNEAIAPIQNKVGQFLSSSLIRNIVGQTRSTIDMREIMDSGKILLMNLSKGRIGEENAALLGAMMITKIQLAAMSRVNIDEHERRDFFLYVDEFQNFSTESFANILSEARKYRLCLVMAHQYIEQLSDPVRAAVFGNVGTMIVFRVGATDAEEFEKEFQPVFLGEDIVTLPAHHIYLRLMIDGVTSEPFSATTLPPIAGETENRSKVVQVSRERYGRKREVVEEKIRTWAAHSTGGVDGESEHDDDFTALVEPVVAPAAADEGVAQTNDAQYVPAQNLAPLQQLTEPILQEARQDLSSNINLLNTFASSSNAIQMDAVPVPRAARAPQRVDSSRAFESLYTTLQQVPASQSTVSQPIGTVAPVKIEMPVNTIQQQPLQQVAPSSLGAQPAALPPAVISQEKKKRKRKRRRRGKGGGMGVGNLSGGNFSQSPQQYTGAAPKQPLPQQPQPKAPQPSSAPQASPIKPGQSVRF